MNRATFAALERANYERDPRTQEYPEPGDFNPRRGLLTMELPPIELNPNDPKHAPILARLLGEEETQKLRSAGLPADLEGYTFEVPAKYRVCHLCRGRGAVVNPGVDCMGLTSEDLAADPGFAEDYFGGRYDVSCPACKGLRVLPTVIAPGTAERPGQRDYDWTPCRRFLWRLVLRHEREEAEFRALCRAERIMGA